MTRERKPSSSVHASMALPIEADRQAGGRPARVACKAASPASLSDAMASIQQANGIFFNVKASVSLQRNDSSVIVIEA